MICMMEKLAPELHKQKHTSFTRLIFDYFSNGLGLFNILKKTWSIYTQNPTNSMPVVTLPMTFK